MKISRQMRIVLGAVVVLGVAGFGAKTFLLKTTPVSLVIPPPVHHAVTVPHVSKSHHAAPPIKLDPNLPSALRLALLHHGIVVAVIYASQAPGDASVVAAARAGALGAHVGFAALDVANNAVAAAVALEMPGTSDPSVAVVKRPGQVTLLLPGYVDSAVVTQAARDAS